MVRAIRKQIYLSPEHERKLKRLARDWHCPEAAVIRQALDRLPDPDGSLEERLVAHLSAAGLLASAPDDPDLPQSEDDIAMLERECDEWAATRGPLGLAQAVDEDRGPR